MVNQKYQIGQEVTVKRWNGERKGSIVKFLHFQNGSYWIGIQESDSDHSYWAMPGDII